MDELMEEVFEIAIALHKRGFSIPRFEKAKRIALEEYTDKAKGLIREAVAEELEKIPNSTIYVESGGEYIDTRSDQYIQERIKELKS